MSSTLFARGTMTQVGQRRRAEEVNKSIADVRAAVESVQELPREFRVMRTRVEAMETHTATITDLVKEIAALKARVAELEKAAATATAAPIAD